MKDPNLTTPLDSFDAWRLPGGVRIPEGALRFQSARSGGPGGQNVNKVNTKMELWLDPARIEGLHPEAARRLLIVAAGYLTAAGEIHLWSQSERSQEQNRRALIDKLRKLVLTAMVRPKRRRPTRPTAASRKRRLHAKRHRGQIKTERHDRGEQA